jgi:hypothetical protein
VETRADLSHGGHAARTVSFGHAFNCRLDGELRSGLNRRVDLYALVASDCTAAIDVFVSDVDAQRTLADVLHDEPAFASLLSVIPLPPPWAGRDEIVLEAHPQ